MANTDNVVYTANSTTITTNFNTTPYYDDYDPLRNHYRILFKPGFAVQARELTQIQSMVQEQIKRFGQHMFKEGSKVLGSTPTIDRNIPYVKVKDIDASLDSVDITKYKGQYITGQLSGLKAYVNLVEDGIQTETNTKTLYISYLNATVTESVFRANETLISDAGTLVTLSSGATGVGSILTLTEGVRFAKSHFVHHDKQSVVVDRYGSSPTCRVALHITESITAANEDNSLLDPALESTNYSAPGADRFTLNSVLERLEIDDVTGPPNYVAILEVRNSVVTELNDRPIYNIVNDEIAKRTNDESGDYYVRGLNVVVEEHRKETGNFGYLSQADGGDNTLLSVQIEPGTAYVKGYEVNKLVTTFLTAQKALDFSNVNNQTVSSRLGNYITVNEAVGSWTFDRGTLIDLYDTAQQRITSKNWSIASQTGNKIGTARFKSINYNSGALGTAKGNLDLHIFDTQMLGSNSFSNVKSIYYNNSTTADIGADVVLTNGLCKIKEPGTTLTYFIGKNAVRSVADSSWLFKRTSDVSISTSGTSNGKFTITANGSAEIYPYGTNTTGLSTTDKKDILLTLNESTNITLPGLTSSVVSGNTIVGNGSTYFTYLNIGDKIELSGNSKTFSIVSIANNNYLTVDLNPPSTISGNTIFKAYKTGDIIDLNSIGVRGGETRSVTTTDTSMTFDLKESFRLGSGSISGTVSYNMSETAGSEIKKTLNTNVYIRIAVGSNTSGPFNLGFSDVFRINYIWKKSSAFSTESTTGATDVTTSFNFDNGQRDDYYGLASITPKTGITLTASDYLLVQLDYFTPDFTQGVGYFSVDSYPVPTGNASPTSTQILTAQIPTYKSPVTGTAIELRNVLDFRPVYQSTANASGTILGSTNNPSVATTILSDASGLRLPVESEQITFDYSYYLPRIDVVALSKNGDFSIIKGIPSNTTLISEVPSDMMAIANILIPPYPSISLSYARALGNPNVGCKVVKRLNIRYTMKDIGSLDKRIKNLEQYVTLSLLEKSALDMKVLDTNGLDRFKNGIFTDSFVDSSYSDIAQGHQHVSFDPQEKSIRPLWDAEGLSYRKVSNTNCIVLGDYAMLPYTEVTLVDQPHATTFRNVESTSYRYVGSLFLNPSQDYWVNTARLNSLQIQIGDANTSVEPYSVSYGAWSAWTGGTPAYYNIDNYSTVGDGYLKNLSAATIKAYATNYSTAYATSVAFGASYYDRYKLTSSTRTVTELFNTVTNDTKSLGDKIVNSSPIADIRAQMISIHGTGLKANTRYFAFFDGKPMSSYVTPATNDPVLQPNGLIPISNTSLITSTYEWPVATRSFSFTPAGTEGAPLYSDYTGNAYGILRIPSDSVVSFRTGSKEVILSDSPSNAADATAAAKTYFYAEGIQSSVQETILTTKILTSVPKTRQETITSIIVYDAPSCMAYSFKVDVPVGTEGTFLTSFDTFFSAKDPTLKVWFEIRIMDSAGGITRTTVPGSEVWLTPSQVNTSTNGSVATNVKFKQPVFLNADTEYALVIHTEGINPNYYMFVSVLGETDLITGSKVNQRGLTGTLYTTNNNLNWNIVERVDLKVKFYRAQFTTTNQGTLVLGNEPFEFLIANTLSQVITNDGEKFVGNDRLTFSSFSGTIGATDYVIGQSSNANVAVTSVSGSTYTMANTGFTSGEYVAVRRANGYLTTVNTSITSKTTATGYLYKFMNTYGQNRVRLASSNGSFYAGDTMRGSISGSTFVVESIDKFRYETTEFQPSFLNFRDAFSNFSMRTTSSSGTTGTFEDIMPAARNYLTSEQAIYSKTGENTLGGGPTNQVRVLLNSSNDYLSPLIDISRTYTTYVHNRVNSDTTNETLSTSGYLTNKYISQIVTLAAGQDSEDLLVILTAYRPPTSNSDVKVYARFSNAQDFEPIGNRSWIPLDYGDPTAYSSLADRNDFIEYSFTVPSTAMVGVNDQSLPIVGYTNSANTTFQGFRQFQIKIGLQSDNSAVYPRVADLRVMAIMR